MILAGLSPSRLLYALKYWWMLDRNKDTWRRILKESKGYRTTDDYIFSIGLTQVKLQEMDI